MKVRFCLLFMPGFWREDSVCEFAPVVNVRFWPAAEIEHDRHADALPEYIPPLGRML